MNRFARFITALSLALAGSSALANQSKDRPGTQTAKPQPVQMSDAQMDSVAGGALINAVLVDVVDVNNNDVQVAIPVNAAVAIGILGAAGSAALQRPGRQIIQ